jgi:hypothetical protein
MSEPDESIAGLPPTRIEALADGIFAVAMTLLVLELHVPDLAHQLANADTLVVGGYPDGCRLIDLGKNGSINCDGWKLYLTHALAVTRWGCRASRAATGSGSSTCRSRGSDAEVLATATMISVITRHTW